MKTNVKKEFKQTEIGEIPADWEVVRFCEVVNYFLGRTPPRKELKYWSQENEGIPWVSISDMKPFSVIYNTEEKLTRNAIQIMPQISKKGTLIMSFKLTVGRTSILGIDAYHNEAIISIYPKENILKEFLLYYLPKVNYSILQDRAVKGQTLNKSKIDNIPIIVPPLSEQKKIVGVLSKIQEAVENQRKIIEKLEELKKSTMDKLFTKGLYGKETKQTEIGEIPADWEVVRLGDVVNVEKGKKPKVLKNEYIEGGLPYLVTDYFRNGIAKQYVPKSELEENILCDNNDIVMIWDGSNAGDCFYASKGVLASTMVKITSKKEYVLPDWVYFFVKLNFKYLNKRTTGATIPHINPTVFYNLLIPIPPLEEQKKITEILSKIDKMKEEAERKLDYLNEFFNSALDLLITGKVRLK